MVEESVEESVVEPEPYMRPSRVGSFFSLKKKHDLPLQPRLLARKSKWRKVTTRTVVSLVVCGAVVVLCMFGVDPVSFATYYREECDEATTTGLESYFLINVRLNKRFTYTNARLVDLCWDIVIGQGGRFLHGWILYYYVISPNITRIMERGAVPYELYADLSFDTSSLQSLWTLFRSFPRMYGGRSIFSMIWYIFAIGYVLSFTALWDASTGYLNPTTRYYRMPDGSYITPDQIDLLSLCWSHNDQRLSGLIPEVVQSPNLREINATYHQLAESQSGFEKLDIIYVATRFGSSMPLPPQAPADMSYYSSDFASLYNCKKYPAIDNAAFPLLTKYKDAMTQAELQSFLHSSSYTDLADAMIDGPLNSSTLELMVNGTTTIDSGVYLSQRWAKVHAWLYSAATSDIESTNKLLGSSFNTLQDSRYGLRWAYNQVNSTGWPANFVYDNSTRPGRGVVPYNSSITVNGTMHSLPSPFVQLGQNCHRFQGLGNPCLCYRGTPIAYPLDDHAVICVAESGYVWGFSSVMLSVSLVLECMWMIGCLGVWLDAHVNSELENMQRSSAGAVRTAFDLVEAAKKVLGDDISTYSNQELRDALKKCETVGFKWEDDGEGTSVRMVPRESEARKRKESKLRKKSYMDKVAEESSSSSSSCKSSIV